MKSITFECVNCRSPFTVDSRLSGRKARCKRCNNKMLIPDESTGGEPVGPLKISRTKKSSHHKRKRYPFAPDDAPVKSQRPISWLEAVNSQVGLKSVSIMSDPDLRPKVKEDDSFDSSITSYKLPASAQPKPVEAMVKKSKDLVNAGVMETVHSYKKFFGKFAYLFRKINEWSYGLSVVCLIAAIVGAIMGNHSVTIMCVSAIVLLNIIGLAAGMSNLIALRFRKNPLQGLLILIPPVALYYLCSNSAKWRKPINRVMTPIAVMAAVIGAYLYIPWLNGNQSGQASWKEKIEGAVESIRHDVGDTISEAGEKAHQLKDQLPEDLKDMDLDKVKKKASDAVDGIKSSFDKPAGSGGAPDNKDR